MNKIYQEFYKNKVFTIDEARKIIKNYQVLRNTLNRLVHQKLIKKIKGGLYYIVPIDNSDFHPDPIHIASKLRPDAIITASSALKVHKLISQDQDTLYIVSKSHSKKRLDKHTYRIIKGNNVSIKMDYQTSYGLVELKVTDIERTIIECVKTRSIKAVDLINIIKTNKPNIDIKKIQSYLEKQNMTILYNKLGLILEACTPFIKVDQTDLDKLRKKLSKKIYYYKEPGIRLIRPKYHYHKEWNIMIPDSIYNLIQSMKPMQNVTA